VAGAATYDEANTLLFTIIQSSIDGDKEPQLAKTATMTKYRGNGVSFLKHLFDKIGPGSLSRQTAKKLRLQGETQQETETGEQFCDRLIMENSSLTTSIDGSMMCSIFIKGCIHYLRQHDALWRGTYSGRCMESDETGLSEQVIESLRRIHLRVYEFEWLWYPNHTAIIL